VFREIHQHSIIAFGQQLNQDIQLTLKTSMEGSSYKDPYEGQMGKIDDD